VYHVDLSQRAAKFLTKLNVHVSERIQDKLKTLGPKPVPKDAKFLGRNNNDKVFRIRIGDFRALYKIKKEQKIVLVTKIDKRPRVYK